ncbi:MAG: hypothetical protein IPF38_04055 [Burkholderiales bacterium]|nr:hypothetical protein [Burkholderiales bacterium]
MYIPLIPRSAGALALTLMAFGLGFPLAATADTPQRLSATVDGKLFESDDDGIMYLMPTKGVLNLIASTKGASAYPPPKTPVDKLSINCSNFDGKPVKFIFAKSGSRSCEISFTQGVSQKPFGEPVAEYRMVDGKNQLEITSVNGKVIEGTFSFEFMNVKTKAKMVITDGKFKAEDRQL